MYFSKLDRFENLELFAQARRQANWARSMNRLLGRPQTLLPFAPIQQLLVGQSWRKMGVQAVKLKHVVGSVSRAAEFDRRFRPLSDALRERWINVGALNSHQGWEPVELLQVGDLYFVEDGHHRVSVANSLRLQMIEANVRVVPLPLSFGADVQLDELIDCLRNWQMMQHC